MLLFYRCLFHRLRLFRHLIFLLISYCRPRAKLSRGEIAVKHITLWRWLPLIRQGGPFVLLKRIFIIVTGVFNCRVKLLSIWFPILIMLLSIELLLILHVILEITGGNLCAKFTWTRMILERHHWMVTVLLLILAYFRKTRLIKLLLTHIFLEALRLPCWKFLGRFYITVNITFIFPSATIILNIWFFSWIVGNLRSVMIAMIFSDLILLMLLMMILRNITALLFWLSEFWGSVVNCGSGAIRISDFLTAKGHGLSILAILASLFALGLILNSRYILRICPFLQNFNNLLE